MVRRARDGAEAAGWPPLARELAVILLVKVIVLAGLWYAFFSGPEAADDPAAVAERVLHADPARTPSGSD